MNKSKHFFYMLISVFILVSCSQSTQKNDTEETELSGEELSTPTKEVDQLTFQDVVAMVYDDEGEGIEWHGEEMPNELIEFLVISSEDPCGEGDCGRRLTLTNNSDQSITTIIRGEYDIEGDQGQIPRKYVIDGGGRLLIGCTHLCYGGKGYEFTRTIVASAFTADE